MPLTRRTVLTAMATAGGAGLFGVPAFATDKRGLDISIVGFTLGIHIPAVYALRQGIAEMPGYARSNVSRIDRLPVITQSIVSGQGDLADGDVVSTLKAAEAGADVRIIGLTYNNTSQVFVANAARVRSIEDLGKPGVTVAVNAMGDFMHVMLMGPLTKRGLDLDKLTVIEIGGSGNRMRALMAGRVDAVPVHFDQAREMAKKGNFITLIEPWVEYDAWFGQVLFTTDRWLSKPANRRTAVDVLKAVLIAFRRANRDLDWFTEQYRAFATTSQARDAKRDDLRDTWATLAETIRAWPDDMDTLTPEHFAGLLPHYRRAGALNGTIDFTRVIDRTYLDQALHELQQTSSQPG